MTPVSRAPLVVVEHVSRVYARGASVRALHDVSLTIGHGETVAVMGPSGSGKTTLLNILGGLDRPTSGRVSIDGVDLTALDEHARTLVRRSTIASVFQQAHLMPTLSAADNVALPLHLRGHSRRAIAPLVDRALSDVGLLARRDHLPDELSGGERQRVAVARALVIAPALILADEPTGNLDSATGDQILALFARVTRDRGAALVLVTHDPHAATLCDRLIRIRDGRVEPPLGTGP